MRSNKGKNKSQVRSDDTHEEELVDVESDEDVEHPAEQSRSDAGNRSDRDGQPMHSSSSQNNSSLTGSTMSRASSSFSGSSSSATSSLSLGRFDSPPSQPVAANAVPTVPLTSSTSATSSAALGAIPSSTSRMAPADLATLASMIQQSLNQTVQSTISTAVEQYMAQRYGQQPAPQQQQQAQSAPLQPQSNAAVAPLAPNLPALPASPALSSAAQGSAADQPALFQPIDNSSLMAMNSLSQQLQNLNSSPDASFAGRQGYRLSDLVDTARLASDPSAQVSEQLLAPIASLPSSMSSQPLSIPSSPDNNFFLGGFSSNANVYTEAVTKLEALNKIIPQQPTSFRELILLMDEAIIDQFDNPTRAQQLEKYSISHFCTKTK